jgi:chymotrypsin-like protease
MRSVTIIFCIFPTLALLLETDLQIINGKDATDGQFPWQAIITERQTFDIRCSGALISYEWILTVADCLIGAGKTNLILLGMADRENATHGVVTIANDYIVHENFTYGIPANNIALVKLAKPVTSMLFQDYVKPITLPEQKYKPGTKITVSGWGLTDDGTNSSTTTLKYTTLTKLNKKRCIQQFGVANTKTGVFCAGDENKVKGPCDRDEGSPAVVKIKKNPILVGLENFISRLGCEKGNPSVYTDVFYYREWIREKTGI